MRLFIPCLVVVLATDCNSTTVEVLRGSEAPRLDTAFGDGGIVVLDLDGADTIHFTDQGVTEDSAGRLSFSAIAGESQQLVVARMTDDGRYDPSFGEQGIVRVPDVASAKWLAATSDGDIVLVAEPATSNEQGVVVRLLDDGSLDASFAGTGRIELDVVSGEELYNGVIPHTDGTIVVGAQALGPLNWDVLLVRLLANGDIDTSFGDAGYTFDDLSGGDEFVSVISDALGRPHVVGQGYDGRTVCLVARYELSGALDLGFASDGIALLTSDTEGESRCPMLAFGPSGDIVVAGSAVRAGSSDTVVWRLDANGSERDTRASEFAGDDSAMAVVVLNDGRIIIGGTAQSSSLDVFLWALDADGVPDEDFGGSGKLALDLGSDGDTRLWSLLVDHAGRLVIYAEIARDGRRLATLARILL